MVLADWIVLAAVVLFALIGLFVGFGGTLKFFTGGIFGVIISVVVCYFLYGVVIGWEFVQALMDKLVEAVAAGNNVFCDFLLKIKIEHIVLCLAMFILVQIARVIVVLVIKNVAEIKNPVMKVLNKALGLVFMTALALALILIVFQIVAWIGGGTAESFLEALNGSGLKLDWLFINNPMKPMFQ